MFSVTTTFWLFCSPSLAVCLEAASVPWTAVHGSLTKNSRGVKGPASHVFANSYISQSPKCLILRTQKISHWNLWLKSFQELGILPSSLHPKVSYKRDKDHESREGWEIIGPMDTPCFLPGYEASDNLTLCISVKVRRNPNLALLCVVNEMLENNGKQLKRLHKKEKDLFCVNEHFNLSHPSVPLCAKWALIVHQTLACNLVYSCFFFFHL